MSSEFGVDDLGVAVELGGPDSRSGRKSFHYKGLNGRHTFDDAVREADETDHDQDGTDDGG